MSASDLYEKLGELAERSGRYHWRGLEFVLRCVEHCRGRLSRAGHVAGRELLESARQLAISEYGPSAKMVLNGWGIESTEDIGRIVFLMVDNEILSKTEDDSLDDFRDGFDFETEFVRKHHW